MLPGVRVIYGTASCAVLGDDKAAEDLATARLGDGVGDHGASPQLLERGHALVDECDDLLLAQLLTWLGLG